ncbi:14559_t:CDS:1 [Cetraspora pellucida]|uniref:14559_t:CDS:1 n=1 Tax=Cetraspora pellucida TaxID=1433469 RepID=A0ACA9N349_9GLOM|nr:14559_t:CDS:1 [Cetraspora pellucida]
MGYISQSTQQVDLTSIQTTEPSSGPIYSTFANYRLGNLAERSELFITPPPPTYRNDLPPPYSAKSVSSDVSEGIPENISSTPYSTKSETSDVSESIPENTSNVTNEH